jgi:hypothetical protein
MRGEGVLTMTRSLVMLCVVLLTLSTSVHAQPSSWLDGPRPDWNTAGSPVPSPKVAFSAAQCESSLRPAETAEDEAVVAAGWGLVSAYRAGWGVKVVTGTIWLDGMCRPVGYQVFVFADGQYAGSISPDVMSSRSGDPGSIRWFDHDTVAVNYNRFRPNDPLCCPSGQEVDLRFRIDRAPDGPVILIDRR